MRISWISHFAADACFMVAIGDNKECVFVRYKESNKKGNMRYEHEFLVLLEGIIQDLTRRLHRGVERLDRTYHNPSEVSNVTS